MEAYDAYDLLTISDVFAPHLQYIPDQAINLQGTLFIAGLSDCGSEFHLGTLLSVSDPEDQESGRPSSKRYLFVCKPQKADKLAKLLNDNNFELVVIVNLVHGKQMTQHKRLASSLHNAVTVEDS